MDSLLSIRTAKEPWRVCFNEEKIRQRRLLAIIRDTDTIKHLVSPAITLLHWRVAKGIFPSCLAIWIIGGSYRYRSIIMTKRKITGEQWHPAHISRQIRPSLEHGRYKCKWNIICPDMEGKKKEGVWPVQGTNMCQPVKQMNLKAESLHLKHGNITLAFLCSCS